MRGGKSNPLGCNIYDNKATQEECVYILLLLLLAGSRALLASSLAPAMKASPDPRVLTVLSAGVHGPYKHYAEDPELSLGHYSLKNGLSAQTPSPLNLSTAFKV